jgi:iron(III) transport system permease protein
MPSAIWRPSGGGGVRTVTRAALFVILIALVAVPLLSLVINSFQPAGALPFAPDILGWMNYAAIFSTPGSLVLLTNTLAYAVGSVAIGIGLAIGFAYLTERTDLPFRTTIRILMFSWMTVPPLVFGYGWIMLLNPGNGVVNVVIKAIFGLTDAPLTPYSLWSLIAISGLGLVPTAYVMIAGLLRNIDPTLEDAGSVCGASRIGILLRITAPLLRPGTLSVSIFLIMAMVQSFDLPMIIGLTARVPVLSTRIYLATSPDTGIPNYGLASAFGVCLLILAGVLMISYFRALRSSERFRTVTGKGFRPRRLMLSPIGRALGLAGVGLYLATMLLPIAILAWSSLLPSYRPPGLEALGEASLATYASVLGEPQTLRVIGNTILLFVTSATCVMALACLVSWFAVRGGGLAGKALDMLAFAPMAIPPVVMAIALLLVMLHSPLNGTIWVLVIGHVSIYIAFGTRTMNAAFIQIHKELEDAAMVSGATWATSLRRILFPIVWPQILNAWLWVIAHSARDLTFPLMLLTSSNVVAATAIYQRWDYPDLPGAAALSMLVVVGLMALVVPLQIYLARRADGQGG